MSAADQKGVSATGLYHRNWADLCEDSRESVDMVGPLRSKFGALHENQQQEYTSQLPDFEHSQLGMNAMFKSTARLEGPKDFSSVFADTTASTAVLVSHTTTTHSTPPKELAATKEEEGDEGMTETEEEDAEECEHQPGTYEDHFPTLGDKAATHAAHPTGRHGAAPRLSQKQKKEAARRQKEQRASIKKDEVKTETLPSASLQVPAGRPLAKRNSTHMNPAHSAPAAPQATGADGSAPQKRVKTEQNASEPVRDQQAPGGPDAPHMDAQQVAQQFAAAQQAYFEAQKQAQQAQAAMMHYQMQMQQCGGQGMPPMAMGPMGPVMMPQMMPMGPMGFAMPDLPMGQEGHGRTRGSRGSRQAARGSQTDHRMAEATPKSQARDVSELGMHSLPGGRPQQSSMRGTMTPSECADELTPAEWDRRIAQRKKQIALGKATEGYRRYITQVPKASREHKNPMHCVTPDPSDRCSKRRFDLKLQEWRVTLHMYDEVTATGEGEEGETTPQQDANASAPASAPQPSAAQKAPVSRPARPSKPDTTGLPKELAEMIEEAHRDA